MMRRTPSLVATFLAAGALALTGCAVSQTPLGPTVAPPTAQAAPSLVGSSWDLAALSVPAANTIAVGSSWLSFQAGGSFTGSTGCNSLSGSWAQRDWALQFTAVATTFKLCTGALGEQERAVLAALGDVTSFKGGTTDLRLLDASATPRLLYAPTSTALVGPTWRATGVNNGAGAVTAVPLSAGVTAVFDATGRVSGSGGCNGYGATYTAGKAGALTITGLMSTTMACVGTTGAGSNVEGLYFTALGETAVYSIEHDTLILRDGNGAMQVTYTSATR